MRDGLLLCLMQYYVRRCRRPQPQPLWEPERSGKAPVVARALPGALRIRGAQNEPRHRARLASEGHPPDFKKAVKASPLWLDFDVHRTRLRTERYDASCTTQRASSAIVRLVSMLHPAHT